jgi:uncharacterized protein YjiS (DUF1127 family)
MQESTTPTTVQAQGFTLMNAHAVRNDMPGLNSTSLGHYFEEDTYIGRQEPASQGLFARIGSVVRWISELPRRHAALAELTSLSDHELADIGLTRSDLPRLFDPEFVAERNRERLG